MKCAFFWVKSCYNWKEYYKSAGRGYKITQNNVFLGQTMVQLDKNIKKV